MRNIWKAMFLCTFLCGMSATGTIQAQDDGVQGPPKVLFIVREVPKPGKGGSAHEKSESAYVNAVTAAKAPIHYVALSSVTGPDRDLFLSGYSSFADMQAQHKAEMSIPGFSATIDRINAADGDLLLSTTESAWTRRDDQSFNSAYVPGTRFMEISLYQIKPGHMKEWDELVKLVKSAYQKSMPDANWTVYEEAYGEYMNAFLVIVPMKSMAEIDHFFAMDKSFAAALGDEGMKKLDDLEAACVQEQQTNLFAVDPKISLPPQEWVKQEPGFWKPKPAPVKKAQSTP